MAMIESEDQLDALRYLLEPLICKHLHQFLFSDESVKCVCCGVMLIIPRSALQK